ncbi:MAG: KamA family radical SAM protein [Chloroflexi bacterium]|nr:KamA family radical SAM protein [Chloroflexota bacterium]
MEEKHKVKASLVKLKSQPVPESENHCLESCSNSDSEEEPPSKRSISDDLEEEPPSRHSLSEVLEEKPSGKIATTRYRFFGDVPDSVWNDWKWQFRNRITSVEQLAKFIPLSAEEIAQLKLVTMRYPLSVTPYYLSLINPDDPDDPIRKQAIPSALEMTMGSLGVEDPLGEREDTVVPGLVHRYPDRVLMVLTDICPMFCRHCTRKREWRNGGWVRTPAEVEAMLDYISQHRAIRDVIISGGDPLTLSTRHLEDIISRIRKIKHVEIIRIGTRFPVVLPQRIDNELCSMLSKYGPIWLNTHFNHVREITPEAAEACDHLLRSGVPVNNQSVLLRGVNDSVEAQTALCHELLKIKVRPYYLFQCDEVQGTEHLRTPVEVGVQIIEGMRGHTSGLAVPTFVIDLPQGGGKVPLQPNYIVSQTEGELVLRNYEGHIFHYRNPPKVTRPEPPAEVLCPAGSATASSPQEAAANLS